MTDERIAKRISSVFAASAPKRLNHFLTILGDRRSAWGLFDGQWALVQDDQGRNVLPIWATEEYAEHLAIDSRGACVPREISLEEITTRMIPHLEESGTRLCVMMAPDYTGVNLTAADFHELIGKYFRDVLGENV